MSTRRPTAPSQLSSSRIVSSSSSSASRVAAPAGSTTGASSSSSRLTRPGSSLSQNASTDDSAIPPPTKKARILSGKVAPAAGAAAVGGGSKAKEGGGDGESTNIEVVVRCRGRSSKEIAENSPIIISTEGPVGQTVTIATSTLTSVVPSLTSAPATRTYSFDHVFGPEADQALVYDSVVKGTLDEVMMGYNCTIFCYGQTGTGKTYTMQGDLTPNILGGTSSEAGIVPRTLHRLFSLLDALCAEYSVKASYLELYNEEIRDLLAPDSSTHHSSGAGPVVGGLKIYDDPNPKGKGVLIQGLEECFIKDAKDGIMLLRKGSARRETGETLMNKTSSRSHSIFSLTIHIKETSSTGEELLKVGKFNLVDLAGSENIGRSGAEDKRAQEAGKINQSLLTLGRVINHLVEKQKHIPYRDSKLTRLLQDSLGGTTKTRIIATISPSRSNMEETLSTLDYAMRATRIQNRPEINQKMTKGALIKDYILEIERLKADLLATREKNGVHLSEESWRELAEEKELQKTREAEEKSRRIILETKLAQKKTELEDSLKLFLATESDLKLSREEVTAKVEELVRKEEQLQQVKTVASSFGSSTAQATVELAFKLENFRKTQSEMGKGVAETVKSFQTRNAETLASQLSILDTTLASVTSAAGALGKIMDASVEERAAFVSVVNEARFAIHSSLGTWCENFKGEMSSTTDGLMKDASKSISAFSRPFNEAVSSVESMAVDVRQHVQSEQKASKENHNLVADAVQEEIHRLADSEKSITSLVSSQKAALLDFQTRISLAITSVVSEFTATQTQQLDAALTQAKAQRQLSEQRIRAMQLAHQERSTKAVEKARSLGSRVEQLMIRGVDITKAGTEAITVVLDELNNGLSGIAKVASVSLDCEMKEIEKHFVEMSDALTKSSTAASKSQDVHASALQSLVSGSETSHASSRQSFEAVRADVQQTASHLAASQSTTSHSLTTFVTTSTTSLSTLRDSTNTLLTSLAHPTTTLAAAILPFPGKRARDKLQKDEEDSVFAPPQKMAIGGNKDEALGESRSNIPRGGGRR